MFNVENDNIVGKNDFTDCVKIYYKELKKYKPLPKEKEKELMSLAKKGNIEARNTIISSNLRFVFNMAKKYRGRGVSIDDLISEGNKGMIKAFEMFDESKDVKFFTYAVFWIKQEMIEAVSGCIKESKKEIAYDEVFPQANGDVNLSFENSIYADDEDSYEVNFYDISDDSLDSIKNNDDDNQKKFVVRKLLNKLNKKERLIIEKYYGLEKNDDGHSLEEISQDMKISSERIRQLRLNALDELREMVFDIKEADFLFC